MPELKTTFGTYKMIYQGNIPGFHIIRNKKLAAILPLKYKKPVVTVRKGEDAPLILSLISIVVNASID